MRSISGRAALAAAALIMTGTAGANAATLSVVAGEVYLDRGRGYARVAGTVDAAGAQTVLVKTGGRAVLACTAAQSVTLDAAGVYDVAASCAVAPAPPRDYRGVAAAGLGVVGLGALVGIAAASSDDDGAPPASGQ